MIIHKNRLIGCLCFLSNLPLAGQTQTQVNPPSAIYPVPSPTQMAWHEMEMNAFIHFSLNTYTDKEWGMGNESPKLFNPGSLQPEQWTSALKAAGFKGLILTAKHHDGFCLWPSRFTDHSVKNSLYKDGKGDAVSLVAEACRKDGLKFGIYLSPWDRNHPDYGKPEYITYYRNQLKELFMNYGPVFEMWFDGANGGDGYYGGKNEIRKIDGSTYYDWPTTIKMVRSIQPGVLFFSDAGPDIRWVGNERGVAGETNWNMMDTDTVYAGKAGIEDILNTGSVNGKQWIPAEVDVSIRPGWFYHESQNKDVKNAEQLFQIYLTSVGRGSTLLLNIPPDPTGLFHENDLRSLEGFRKILDQEFGINLAKKANVTSNHHRGMDSRFSPLNLVDTARNTYWTVDDDSLSGSFEIKFNEEQKVKYVVLQEHISLGQRVKKFNIEVWEADKWKQIFEGTTIGYKRIVKLPELKTRKIRVNINDARACPVISNVEVY